jgi:hypothetical protein
VMVKSLINEICKDNDVVIHLLGCSRKEHGEEGWLLRESKPEYLFFNSIFYSNKGILVTLHPQNDVVLGFSSIFTVSSNRMSQIIRGR